MLVFEEGKIERYGGIFIPPKKLQQRDVYAVCRKKRMTYQFDVTKGFPCLEMVCMLCITSISRLYNNLLPGLYETFLK